MPETIRRTGGRSCSHPGRRGFRSAAIALVTAAGIVPAHAEGGGLPDFGHYIHALAALNRSEIIAMVLTLGVLLFGVVTAVMLVRTRIRAGISDSALRDRIAAVRADHDRLRTLLMSDPQVLVSWAAADNEPDIMGDISLVTTGSVPQRVLAFGSWLEAEKAQAMERATDALRAHGEGFAMQLLTLSGRAIEADGRAIGGRAVLRLRDVSGFKRELTELQARHEKLLSDMESLRSLIDALPSPVWTRDNAGALTFVNTAYVRAVEARDVGDVLKRALELLNRPAREEASRARASGNIYAGRQPAIVAGSRRNFDIIDVPTRRGSAGIGIDVTEAEQMRTELKRLGDAHRRTLDQLSTGVAIFNAEQHLVFYNAAYRGLWNLDPAFLDQYPTDSSLLDQLRATRKLPEEKDYREWKAALHEAYRATETHEHLWHLPNRSTLRVVTTPNPEGGVTYLFDDVTESLQMARDFDALIRVQRETLDNLAEAVAVFGSDGRLRLHNPAFAAMWQLAPEALAEQPHIETVIERCRPLYGDEDLWQRLRAAVTAIEGRDSVKARLELNNHDVADLVTVPLPDGATLVAFLDVTDTIKVERVLRERNEALITADALKVDFVHHVSYELRSPLTNIIGFAQLMAEPSLGALSAKQREYLNYIGTSTNALLAIINDILDLASIDAGAMKLNLGPVDISGTMHAAAEGIRDRLVKNGVTLDIVATPDIGSFTADDRRIRQILFNLLANAVKFSPSGAKITLSAERHPDAIDFAVADTGSGIPPEVQGRVFDWFQTHSRGSGHRGAGLGLSIVRSFVELHGGTVTLQSAVGEGTTVICRFPLEQHVERTAA